MRKFGALVRRELMTLFFTPLIYVVAAVFLLFCGWIFYLSVVRNGAAGGEQVFRQAFGGIGFISWVTLPLITMRLLAEETKTGTLEMLMTAPVGEWTIAVAKFISALIFYAALLLPTWIYILIINTYTAAPIDTGPVLGAYVGLMLLAGAFLSIGLAVSALTQDQIVAALLTFVIFMGFWVIDIVGAIGTLESFSAFCAFISFEVQFSDFAKGVIESRAVVYFLSVWLFGIFVTVRILESRRWA
jgi:ABC-2 type transport system permease protein